VTSYIEGDKELVGLFSFQKKKASLKAIRDPWCDIPSKEVRGGGEIRIITPGMIRTSCRISGLTQAGRTPEAELLTGGGL